MMPNLLFLFLFAILAMMLAAFFYFRAACQLSLAEKWLTDFADLQNWRKNRALTYRLLRAILGKQTVQNRAVLNQLRFCFALLLFVMIAILCWSVYLLYGF